MTTTYRLPDGQLVAIDEELTRGAATITYTLKGGAVVEAVRAPVSPSSTVRNMRTGETREYSLPARRALIAADRQARGDYNTWDYPIDSSDIAVGRYFYFLGDWAVRKDA